MKTINFNISTLIGAFVIPLLLTGCNSTPNDINSPKKEHEQIQRTATITLLSDTCAKEQVELAIQETRKTNPELGFNLYYSKVGIPAGHVVNLEFIKCGADTISISGNTSETPEIETFISLIKP